METTSNLTSSGQPETSKRTPAGPRPISEKNRFLSLVDELVLAKQQVDNAHNQYRLILRRAKNDGFNTKEMIRAVGERRTDPQTREANKSAFLRYSSWLADADIG